ncbi:MULTISPECIES: HIT family protein [unclassified Devosia]|uniref:HIT family protein n=1 Tax=unclassified Devosia TaxID=196773 RepID=UPI00145E2FEC|nr:MULTISPECIES: HIT family protein [unclassified Devosia]MBJ7579457.1 HIT family protein [Devosia sp. MC532]
MTEACRFCLANNLLFDSPVAATEHFYMLRHADTRFAHGVMVIPKRHSETPFELSPEEWQDFANAIALARDLLAPSSPEGFTMGWNVGAVAGQTVFHTHLHMIARYSGDPHEGNGIRRIFKIEGQE